MSTYDKELLNEGRRIQKAREERQKFIEENFGVTPEEIAEIEERAEQEEEQEELEKEVAEDVMKTNLKIAREEQREIHEMAVETIKEMLAQNREGESELYKAIKIAKDTLEETREQNREFHERLKQDMIEDKKGTDKIVENMKEISELKLKKARKEAETLGIK